MRRVAPLVFALWPYLRRWQDDAETRWRRRSVILGLGGLLLAWSRPLSVDSTTLQCLDRASAPRTARAVETLPSAIQRFEAGLPPRPFELREGELGVVPEPVRR